jgi:hypothetical protein
VKAGAKTSKQPRREIFVLTAGEKRIVAFVLIAFVLGLTTKHYRGKELALQPKTQIETASPASEKKRSPRPKRTPVPEQAPLR